MKSRCALDRKGGNDVEAARKFGSRPTTEHLAEAHTFCRSSGDVVVPVTDDNVVVAVAVDIARGEGAAAVVSGKEERRVEDDVEIDGGLDEELLENCGDWADLLVETHLPPPGFIEGVLARVKPHRRERKPKAVSYMT